MKGLSLAWIVASVAMFAAPAAFAHAVSTSFLAIDAAGDDAPVSVRWDLSLQDLVWNVFIDSDADGIATWGEIQGARPAIASAVLAQISVERGDGACALRVRDFALAKRLEQNFLSV